MQNNLKREPELSLQGKKVAIIGAGPAGLACAQSLLEQGFQVDLFEVNSKVGGMSRSIEVMGQISDLGPHYFRTSVPMVQEYWERNSATIHKVSNVRQSRILYQGKLFSYPLKGFEALFKLGLFESIRCVLSYCKSLTFPRKEKTFEAWVANAFGYRLYEIFFKTYSEKLWGVKCSELSDQFAKERIRSLNLFSAVKNALLPHKGESKIRSLRSHFNYPQNGTGEVFDKCLQDFLERGGKLFTNHKVVEILTSEHKVSGIVVKKVIKANEAHDTNGPLELEEQAQKLPYDYVVSSGVFTDMVNSIKELPSDTRALTAKLRFRNTLLVFLQIDPSFNELPNDHWLYVHSKNVLSGRMSDAANWSAALKQGQKEHIIAFEYWADEKDELWQRSDEQLIAQAQADARACGLFDPRAIKEGFVHRLYKSYPMYVGDYAATIKELSERLDQIEGLYFIGRNGSFKYNNMDHSIHMGLLAAQKIAGQYQGSLWDLNFDGSL